MTTRAATLLLLVAAFLGLSGVSVYDCTGRESVSAPPPEEREELERDAARQELEAEVGEAARDEKLREEIPR